MPDQIILVQVRLPRVLGVRGDRDKDSWIERIGRMSADFVVCKPDSSILAVIELEHQADGKIVRSPTDELKDKAFLDAGIVLHRWQAQVIPDERVIQRLLSPNRTGLMTS